MKELSLNVLDLAQNSITAGASLLEIELLEDPAADLLTLRIRDNGCGMSEEQLRQVTDPFTTSRQTRRVGLGIPLAKLAAEQSGGTFRMESEVGKGTLVEATFGLTHIDRPPVGDMAATLLTLLQSAESFSLHYRHSRGAESFGLSSDQLREILGDVPLSEPEVLAWLLDYIRQGEASLETEIE